MIGEFECSALHFSAALGKAESCALLCKAGAEVDLQDKDGKSSQNSQILSSLIEETHDLTNHKSEYQSIYLPPRKLIFEFLALVNLLNKKD